MHHKHFCSVASMDGQVGEDMIDGLKLQGKAEWEKDSEIMNEKREGTTKTEQLNYHLDRTLLQPCCLLQSSQVVRG